MDCLMTMDMKDIYFHIHIAPHSCKLRSRLSGPCLFTDWGVLTTGDKMPPQIFPEDARLNGSPAVLGLLYMRPIQLGLIWDKSCLVLFWI